MPPARPGGQAPGGPRRNGPGQGDFRAPESPRGPGGQPPRGPGGQPPRRPGGSRPDTGAQATQKIANPSSGATKKIPAGSLGEAMANRNQRSGSGTRPRPAGSGGRPRTGPITGANRAADGSPPSGPPPRRGGGGGSNGPGGRKPKGGKKKSPWRIVRRVMYVLVALAVVIPSAVFLIAYSQVKVPQPGDLKTAQVATVLAADGTTQIAKIIPPQGNRTDVSIDQIPPHVRNAVIAAEDRSFYTNPGFSISGFARAVRDNLMGKSTAGGGSTITQQYVKNALVGNQHSLTRKMRELVISAKMARQWSKDDILTAYLNTIPFGRGTFGINAAAQAYFGKKVQDLTVEEGAMLAATINEPYGLDPENNYKGAVQRWNYVLDGMVSMGNLPQTQRAKMQYPKVQSSAATADKNDPNSGPNGLIKRQVMTELAAAGISDTQINTQGLQITTTIDAKAQQAAVDSVHKNMQGQRPEVRIAVVSVDPKTGGVKAYYGGDNGVGLDYANTGLMTGSTAKVFGLAENLQLGKPLSTMYSSAPLDVHGIKITNAEGETCGVCTIAEALKRSLNTSFYRMELDMGPNGPQMIADMAHKLGIPDSIPGVGKTLTEDDGSGPNDGIILGQYRVRALDMASAYGTLGAEGLYRKPHFVTKVVAADGQVLLDHTAQDAGQQVVSKAVADNVIAAMAPIANWSFKHDLAGGRVSASKTGTTQLGDTGQDRDAWMIGLTPSLSTAVWAGTDQGVALKKPNGAIMYGSGLPSDIWKDTMDGALEGTPKESFPKPDPVGGQAGVPPYSAPYTPPSTTEPYQPPVVIAPTQVEILPGVRIPVPGLQPNPNTQQQQPQQQPSDAGPMSGQPVAPDGVWPTTAEPGVTNDPDPSASNHNR
ncbi:membrane peptidoglycan carboxypeptidase [Nocardia sp. GAS34]|uniref:transglycosylase domain-containing protein n=1 Tax=unclassified Nocardia TaxID=2637762 RepID=UPI003D1AF0DE